MKRFLGYICLAVTLSAAGCSKPAIEEEKGIPMAFGAEEAVTESRTLLDGTSVNQAGNQLTVYDRYTPESGNAVTYMDGTVVECNGTEWIYSPIKYWTETGTHSFLAYLSKYKYKEIELGKTENYPTVTYSDDTETLNVGSDTSPWEITLNNQFDFLYAYHSRNMNDQNNAHSPVTFSLNHLLCAVQFNVVNLIPGISVKFKQFILSGVHCQGSASIGKSGIEPNVSTAIAFYDDGSNNNFQTFSFDGINLNYNVSHNIFANAVTVGEDGYVLLWPHATAQFEKIKVKIGYILDGTEISKQIDLYSPTQTNNWRAGQRYIYNFYIEDNRISFEVKVVPWVEDDVIIEE